MKFVRICNAVPVWHYTFIQDTQTQMTYWYSAQPAG
jgi:hypothetical protein